MSKDFTIRVHATADTREDAEELALFLADQVAVFNAAQRQSGRKPVSAVSYGVDEPGRTSRVRPIAARATPPTI